MTKPLLAAFSLMSASFIFSFFAVLTRIIGFDLPIYFAAFVRDVEGLSLFISLMGLLMIYSIGGVSLDLLKYVIWAFVGGLGAAIWNTFSKKISGQYSATQLNGLDFAFFTLIMGALSLLSGEVWSWPSFNLVWLANLLFVLMFVVTGWLIIYGFKHLDAQKGSLIMLLEVVFGVVIGWIFYQENLGWGALIGGILILLGAILPQLHKKA